jgi:hypothetical protein
MTRMDGSEASGGSIWEQKKTVFLLFGNTPGVPGAAPPAAGMREEGA